MDEITGFEAHWTPAEKANYWFDTLTKCARLLELPNDEPIPSGVLRRVSELIVAPDDFEDRLARACIACDVPDSVYEDLCIEMQRQEADNH